MIYLYDAHINFLWSRSGVQCNYSQATVTEIMIPSIHGRATSFSRNSLAFTGACAYSSPIVTARQRSCGTVMFSKACVCSRGDGHLSSQALPGPMSFQGVGYLWSHVPSESGKVSLVPCYFRGDRVFRGVGCPGV